MDEMVLTENPNELIYGYRDEQGVLHKAYELRELTGEDEEYLTKPEVTTNLGRYLTAFLSRAVARLGSFTPKEVGARKWEDIITSLYVGDRDLLLVRYREFTRGTHVQMRLTCPECRRNFVWEMETSEIPILPLKGDPERIVVDLPRGLEDKDGQRITQAILRLPNGKDQEALALTAQRNMGEANTLLLSRVIKELGGLRVDLQTVRRLTIRDRDAIIQAIAENNFGPSTRTDVYCPHCGYTWETNIQMFSGFLA